MLNKFTLKESIKIRKEQIERLLERVDAVCWDWVRKTGSCSLVWWDPQNRWRREENKVPSVLTTWQRKAISPGQSHEHAVL